MVNAKSYTLDITLKDGSVATLTYGYQKAFRKWAFRSPGITTMIVPCRGIETGNKVANIIAGSIRRNGNIDGLCRSNIDRLVND